MLKKLKELWQKLKAGVRALRGDTSEDVERVAIWSVHPRVQVWYYWVFTVQTLWITSPEVLERVWRPIWHGGRWGTALTGYREAWDAISNQLLSAAITSLIVTEIGGAVAMIASRLYENLQNVRNQRREEGRKEGRKEGRVEGLADLEAERAKHEEERAKHEEERAKHEEERATQAAASTEWLARMQEAQRKGDPFDEAPPWEANGASES